MMYSASASNCLKVLPSGDAGERAAFPSPAGEAACERSVFETAAYREAYSIRNVLRVEIARGTTPGPLLFEDRGDHAVCLARTVALDTAAVEEASAALFALPRLRFVVFEDIDLDGPVSSTALRFRYRNDWVVPLAKPDCGMPVSFRRSMDQKLRRLNRQHDGMRLVIETSPSRALVEEAIRLSRQKIEANGRSYLIDEEETDRLVRLFEAAGTAAVLYHGDHVVSADLFVGHGQEAYAFMGGYDSAYAKESPGLVTMRHGIEHFEAQGFRSVHFMWGDAGYKERLGAVRVPLATLVVPRDARAWLGAGLPAAAARFAILDAKRRLKEHSWLGEPLRLVQRGFFRLRAMVRRES